ncbi:hypothetical protein GHT07_16200 [Caenimonas koreensis DSM 17982]|uniref:Uncharacterized protein n=2 Tax=Caenimonas TaxID=763439 RepID=A0A844AWE6_9BURK|nr:hypothetical protein [Caenimonas koreensis DSM 17982]
MPELQGDRPRRISKCQSFCNCLGVGLINGFVKVPFSHGVGLLAALAGRAATTDMATADDAAAASLGAVAGIAGLGIGAGAGWVAGDLLAHRLGLQEYREGFKAGGAMVGSAPAIAAVLVSSSSDDAYRSIVLLTLQVLFREVTQIIRDTMGNGVMKGVLPALEVLDEDGNPVAGDALARFDYQRTTGAALVYTGTSMAEKVLLQDVLINTFGFPKNYDFTAVFTSGLATSNSSLLNEVFDDVQAPFMLYALALLRGYSVRWKSGGGCTQLLQNLHMGSGVRENIAHHAAMRVGGWAPVDLCVMASNMYPVGSEQWRNLRLLAGAVQGTTEYRHNTVVYGEAGIRRRHAREASLV